MSYGKVVERDVESNFGLLPETFESYNIVEPNDIVMRLTDLQNDQRSLRTGQVTEQGVITSAYVTIVPSADLTPRFAHYLLHGYDLAKVFYRMGGGLRQSLKYADLKHLPLLVPPHSEQTRIANFLDEQTARIDALIAEKERLVEKLTEIIISSVGKCLEVENGNWSRLLYACTTVSRPVDQQDGESYRRLGLFNRGRGIFIRDDTDKDDMGDSEFFWVEAGDLVISGQFAWEGAVALAAPEHSGCVVSHRFPVIRGRDGVVLTEYLFALLMTQFGEFVLNDCARGSAGRNRPLNMGLLMKWKIPIPPRAQQEEIAALVRLREGLRKVSEHSATLLREYRSSLISAAVTGQLDIDTCGREVA